MSTGISYTFAHLSDPHLTTLENVRWRQLLNKRVMGYLSWLKRRRAEHRMEVLDALLNDLHAAGPEHIAITGDLTHIGLLDEYRQVRLWLERLGSEQDVTVIPGNHDAYVSTSWEDSFACWQPYMVSDSQGGSDADKSTTQDIFPSLRVRGPVAFIGLSSAVPSPPFFATGRIGEPQLGQLANLLSSTGEQQLFRVVLVHHPVVPGSEKWRKRLIDANAVYQVIAENGADLVLHGHSHRIHEHVIQSRRCSIPVIGIPSASAIGQRPGRRAQYYLYKITRVADGWKLHVWIREYDLHQAIFRQVDEKSVEIPL